MSPQRPETIKVCPCGLAYTRTQFAALPPPDKGGSAMGLIWRNCACHSTIALEEKETRTMRFTFTHTFFERNHGAPPRGRGSWAFALSPEPLTEEIFFAPPFLTLTEAKAATREAIAGGLWVEQIKRLERQFESFKIVVLP